MRNEKIFPSISDLRSGEGRREYFLMVLPGRVIISFSEPRSTKPRSPKFSEKNLGPYFENPGPFFFQTRGLFFQTWGPLFDTGTMTFCNKPTI